MTQTPPLRNQIRPLLAFAAYSGTGKTTLLEQVIPELARRGLRIGLIKLSHHDFEIDTPGKDSYRLRKAGACQTLLASPYRQALITETPENSTDPDLPALLNSLSQDDLDLVLIEGGRSWPIPKLELHRAGLGRPFLFRHDPHVCALACDCDVSELPAGLPKLDINNIRQIVDFIFEFTSNFKLDLKSGVAR